MGCSGQPVIWSWKGFHSQTFCMIVCRAIAFGRNGGEIARSGEQLQKASSTLRSSRAVPHPSTNRALRRLTSEFGRDPVHSTRYGRWRQTKFLIAPGMHAHASSYPHVEMHPLHILYKHWQPSTRWPAAAAISQPASQQPSANQPARSIPVSQPASCIYILASNHPAISGQQPAASSSITFEQEIPKFCEPFRITKLSLSK